MHAIYKISLHGKRLTLLLIKFINLVAKYDAISNQWLNFLDTRLKKGNVSVLRKLSIIELIERDLQILIRLFVGMKMIKML